MDNRQYILTACSHELYPSDVCFCVLWGMKDDNLGLMPEHPIRGEWGLSQSFSFSIAEEFSTPSKLDMVWLSIVEQKVYSLEKCIDRCRVLNVMNSFSNEVDSLLVGMAPYGKVALWATTDAKSLLVGWYNGERFRISVNDFYDENIDVDFPEICNSYLKSNVSAKRNFMQNGLPPRDLFDNYMKQFTYRYQVILEHWDEDEEKWIKYDEEKDKVIPEFEYIEEALFDGTHDKLHDGGLMKYHEAGKPKKLALKWHIKKSDYSAYFWFDEEICAIFNKFYGQHPDTKTDFIIHIDPSEKKYELSLYRYGLKEPVIIPESAYQLIVFKSGFENYRSDNYNQPTGAWIW